MAWLEPRYGEESLWLEETENLQNPPGCQELLVVDPLAIMGMLRYETYAWYSTTVLVALVLVSNSTF
jgi:hypothetical protein